MVSFYIYSPFTKSLYYSYVGILQNLSRNGPTNILDSYIFIKHSLSQSEATELLETVALLSFNLPSKSRSTLFKMCSQHVLTATQPLT